MNLFDEHVLFNLVSHLNQFAVIIRYALLYCFYFGLNKIYDYYFFIVKFISGIWFLHFRKLYFFNIFRNSKFQKLRFFRYLALGTFNEDTINTANTSNSLYLTGVHIFIRSPGYVIFYRILFDNKTVQTIFFFICMLL